VPPTGVSRIVESLTGRKRALAEILAGIEEKIARRKPLAQVKPELAAHLRNHFEEMEAKALAVKLANVCLAKAHFRARDAVVRSRPISLVADPSNSCNLACPGCVHSAHAKELQWFDWKPGMVSAPRLTALLDHYGPTAMFAGLYNYGEPLVNPETPRFIRHSKGHLLRTILSTNLSLPRFDARAYAESGLDYMVLSIDGATQPVYERFRKKGNLDLVLANVRKMVEAKRDSGRLTPVITWRFLAFEHNVHEIPAAREMARAMGVDRFEAIRPWDISWDDPGVRAAAIENVEEDFGVDGFIAMQKNWNPFPENLNAAVIEREFAREIEPAAANGASKSSSTCEWLYKTIAMDAGGRIFPCCCSPGKNADLVFANFEGAAEGEAFNSPMHQVARGFFATGEAPAGRQPYCVKCEFGKTAFPHRMQIRNYFAMAGADAIDEASLDFVSAW
jgi:MoaA/NifB/PqqE/SkfB family radical SAM enzyme